MPRRNLAKLLTATSAAVILGLSLPSCSGGVFVTGNGHVCCYGQDADILEMFGPCYSSPSLLGLRMSSSCTVSGNSLSDGVWKHELTDDYGGNAVIQDFVPPDENYFVRTIKTSFPLEFIFTCPIDTVTPEKVPVESLAGRGVTSCYRIHTDAGLPFYSRYLAPEPYDVLVYTAGQIRLHPESGNAKNLVLIIETGEGTVCVAFAHSGENAMQCLERSLSSSFGKQMKNTSKDWKKWAREGTWQSDVRKSKLPAESKAMLSEIFPYVSSILRSQQDSGGGILAGKSYHMAYVRDQYGDFRGLMALGHYAEAKRILDFYYGIWKKYGAIHNAQAMGYEGIFHCHENDETEITGYLVLQAMDYFSKTRDVKYIKSIMPMLEWAVNAQRRNIIDGMLPFNGDETYIAGGIVPRKVLFDGSAEATLLFIESSGRLLDFLEQNHIQTPSSLEGLRSDINSCASLYRSNFFIDGKLRINNPKRAEKAEYPATRPGVCLYPGPVAHYPVTYHYKGCLYFCEDCMKKDTAGIVVPTPETFSIPSAYLFPIFIDSRLFSKEEKLALLEQVADLYKRTGSISEQDRILGYDYGMFLYALSEFRQPLADEIFEKMISLCDQYGSWGEYYVNDTLAGCPCRPWESGINAAAAIEYSKTR